jgi:hypothetical protein
MAMKSLAWREPLPRAGFYAVLLLKRCRIDGQLYRVGTVLNVSDTRLRVAANLVRSGAGRPADEATRRDVELFELLRAALPAA